MPKGPKDDLLIDSKHIMKCMIPHIDVPTKEGSPLMVMFGYSGRQMAALVIGMVSLVGGSMSNFAVPALIGFVVDAMKEDPVNWDDINYYCLGMLIIVVISGFMVWIRGTVFNTMSEKIAKEVRYDLFYFILHKDVAFFDETKTGDILSRISSDTSVIQDGLSTNISMFIRCFIFICVTLVILCLISWPLTLITLAGIFPILVVAKFYGVVTKRLSKQVQDQKAEMGSISEEAIACIRTVKAFSTETFETSRYAKRNAEAYRLGKASGIYNGLFSFFIGFMMNGVNALIIYYGAVLAKEGDISVGEITAFLLYMIQLLFNFAVIAMVVGNVYKIAGASEKIVEMMKTAVTVNASGGMVLDEKDVVGEIEIKNVNFHYPTKPSVKVSKDICIKIEKNMVVAFVGTSGCGKSSIMSLIERYYDPIDGEILYSGVNIKKFDPKWLKKQIGIVSQEPALFTGTIR